VIISSIRISLLVSNLIISFISGFENWFSQLILIIFTFIGFIMLIIFSDIIFKQFGILKSEMRVKQNENTVEEQQEEIEELSENEQKIEEENHEDEEDEEIEREAKEAVKGMSKDTGL